MTCIVGLVDGRTVWLGGDSAATSGDLTRTIIKDPKVFVRGSVGFGVCGLPKVMDALAHAISLPEQEGGSDRSFLVSTLVPAIRDGLKQLDCTVEHPHHGTCFQGGALIAYNGHLYCLEGNFQLVESSERFMSVGSGSPHALGSLHATRKVRNAKKRVLAALEASTANAGCAPPFVLVPVRKR